MIPMNENDLAAQLLKRAAEQGSGSADSAAQIADFVIRKDRRRIRLLSMAIIGLWLIAVLLITTVLLPMLAKVTYSVKDFAPELSTQAQNPTSAPAPPAAPPPPSPGAAAYKLIY